MATELEELEVLQIAEEIADSLWHEVLHWNDFARDVVGKQITRAADSIGANIAESYGRFHYGDKLLFLYYARGSLFETKYWVNRSMHRSLINERQAEQYAKKLTSTARQLNRFVKGLKSQKAASSKKTIREFTAEYSVETEIDLFTSSDLDWLMTLDLESTPPSSVSSLQSLFQETQYE